MRHRQVYALTAPTEIRKLLSAVPHRIEDPLSPSSALSADPPVTCSLQYVSVCPLLDLGSCSGRTNISAPLTPLPKEL